MALAFAALPACGPSASTFAEVKSEILTPNCSAAACHGGDSPQRGLKLDAEDVYTRLVDVDAEAAGWKLVVSGDPAASLLYVAVTEGLESDDIDQMPPGFPLGEEKLEMLRSWIEAGASDD